MADIDVRLPAIPDRLEDLKQSDLEELIRKVLAHVQGVLQQEEQMSAECVGLVRHLRDVYIALLDQLEGDGDVDYGDGAIFMDFKRVLGEVPKRQPVGRPFSKVRNDDVRRGERMRGGIGQFHRKD